MLEKLLRYQGVPLLLAGMGMTLGYAPFHLWPISLLCLGYWMWAVGAAKGYKQAISASFIWGLGWQLTSLYWLPRAFYLDAERDWVVGIFGGIPALFAVALWGVLGTILVSVGTIYALKKTSKDYLGLCVPLLWVAVEVVKGLHPMGFPWLPVGAMWAGWLPLAQGASVAGVYGLSLVLLLLAGGVATALAGRWRRVTVAVVAGVVLVLGAAGYVRMGDAEPATSGRTVRLVQPNEQSAQKWDPTYRWEYLQRVADLSFAPGWQTVDALLLPENAVPFYLEQEVEARALLTQRLMPQQVLATGTIGLVQGGGVHPDVYYNRLSVLEPTGEVGSTSNKVLIVPFGEYIPLRGVLEMLPVPGIRTLSQSRLDYTAGITPRLLDLGRAGLALPLVCYEAIFPLFVAEHAAGADFMLNVTNDNWFTGTIALSQHAALARLRAIETGLPMVRVANTGITVVYDGHGRVVTRLPVDTALVRDVVLPAALPATVWRRMWE